MTLNANLRLQHYIEIYQSLPSSEALLPHLQAERDNHTISMEALVADEDVAVGWRSQILFQDRFNLASADRNLLVGDVPAGPAPHAVGGPFAAAWRTYIKTVFKMGFMHQL